MIRLIFLSLSLLLTLPFAQAQSLDHDKLDSLLLHIEANQKSMGSLAIARDGKTIYQRAIGYADVAAGEQASPDTKYGIGSISKTFTAVLTLQLAEEGLLSLDNTLSQYFPELPNADSITIEHLLQHRSGLHNFTDDVDYMEIMEQPMSQKGLLEWFTQKGTDFAPGEQMSYSNTGYVVLSLVLEEASGKSYAELLKKQITEPCGLDDTYVPSTATGSQEGEALSYQKENTNWVPSTQTHPSIPTGAGAVVSTARDLTTFLHCLFSGELISESHLEDMTTMVDNYGYGIFSFPFYEKMSYGHTGGIDGFTSIASYFPEDEISVAYLSNGAAFSNNDLLIGVLSLLYGRDYEFPVFKPAIAVDASQLEVYEGNYVSDDIPLDIKIFVEGEVLKAQATGQGAFPLEAIGEHQFQFEPAKVEIEFTPSENKLILKQGAVYEFTKEQ